LIELTAKVAFTSICKTALYDLVYVPRKKETCSKVKIQHVSRKTGRQARQARQAGRQAGRNEEIPPI